MAECRVSFSSTAGGTAHGAQSSVRNGEAGKPALLNKLHLGLFAQA